MLISHLKLFIFFASHFLQIGLTLTIHLCRINHICLNVYNWICLECKHKPNSVKPSTILYNILSYKSTFDTDDKNERQIMLKNIKTRWGRLVSFAMCCGIPFHHITWMFQWSYLLVKRAACYIQKSKILKPWSILATSIRTMNYNINQYFK